MGIIKSILQGIGDALSSGLDSGIDLVKQQQMKMRELRKIAYPLFSKANKRIKRLQTAKNAVLSPALTALEEKRVPHFSAKGKGYDELLHEVAEAQAFCNLSTSTVTGARKYTKFMEQFSSDVGLDEGLQKEVFTILRMLQERLPPTVFGNIVDTNKEVQYIKQEIDSRIDAENTALVFDTITQESVIESVINRIIQDMMMNQQQQKNFTDGMGFFKIL